MGKPLATIDLGTDDGVRLVKGEWRYSDTKIIDVDFPGPGPDGQPTGGTVKTYDYTPHAGVAGRLTINEHGNHRVSRLEKDGTTTVLADKYDGKRLNSPNDLVYRSDGTLYFTDPPFGLPKFSMIHEKDCLSVVCFRCTRATCS